MPTIAVIILSRRQKKHGTQYALWINEDEIEDRSLIY